MSSTHHNLHPPKNQPPTPHNNPQPTTHTGKNCSYQGSNLGPFAFRRSSCKLLTCEANVITATPYELEGGSRYWKSRWEGEGKCDGGGPSWFLWGGEGGEGASRPWLESFGKRSKVCTYLFLTGNTDPPVQLHRHVNQGPRVAIWSAHHGEGEPQQLTQHLLSLTDAQQPQGPPPSQTQRQQPVYSPSNLLSTPPNPVRRPTNQPTQRSHSINTIPLLPTTN